MIILPGWLLSLLTFPGVIVHEMAHQFFCRLTGTAVLETCYFRLGNPAGFVIHERAGSPGRTLLIAIAPFLVNSVVGAVIATPAALTLGLGELDLLNIFLAWLGVSIAMHSFPSTGDAKSLWSALRKENCWVRVCVTPVVLLIFLGAVLSIVWMDLIYGLLVALGLPNLIVRLLP